MVDGNSYYSGSINYSVDSFECDGSEQEQDLSKCKHDVWTDRSSRYDCLDNQLAGVKCEKNVKGLALGHSSVDVLDNYYCTP